MLAEQDGDYDLADTSPPCLKCPGVMTLSAGSGLPPDELTRVKVKQRRMVAHVQARRRAL